MNKLSKPVNTQLTNQLDDCLSNQAYANLGRQLSSELLTQLCICLKNQMWFQLVPLAHYCKAASPKALRRL